MFDSEMVAEQAILVHIYLSQDSASEDLQELEMLVASAGVQSRAVMTANRSTIDAKFFLGSGKAAELAQAVAELQVDLIIFNHALTPAQTRNLELLCQCRVIDRTTLILDIFAQRARSYEGKLQVELAQLKHLSSRLVRGWDNAERQKGGIGMRGPGETRLETDRRLVREKITALLVKLDKVSKQREQGRKARQRAEIPVVSLVGYTNAGKSTLFNRLTSADVYAADQLFATLDPTLRQVKLPEFGSVIFADTVGFIRHLPHDLVAAFKSTLQESRDADLQLHVIDVADQRMADNIKQVQLVLHEIDADQVPQLLVFNKIDQTEQQARIEYNERAEPVAVYVSAKQGLGIELLLQVIRERLADDFTQLDLKLPADAAIWRARLHELSAVQTESFTELGETQLRIALSKAEWARLLKQSDGLLQNYIVNP
ncbi:GTPase HflX [Rheinheimera mesophila]|uniref:GTPase HflX n=1 Tax=Rheinheimera mesophila TaxID=1547515 RepID=A0A3P3QTX6_9GAMM|nr:ribosome rescue GTPase HflX [Rheinheimera mesophila]KKL01434.1 GTPase HflX [Rheinheimera mesophila]RRJ23800.1 GTPase HflX [Rheinheimera mesophila]